jgi:hypothetical protein
MYEYDTNFLFVVCMFRNRAASTSSAPAYTSTIACLRDVLRTEGVRAGLYRSFFPTLLREIPQYAIYYPTYEVFVRLFCAPGQKAEDLPMVTNNKSIYQLDSALNLFVLLFVFRLKLHSLVEWLVYSVTITILHMIMIVLHIDEIVPFHIFVCVQNGHQLIH